MDGFEVAPREVTEGRRDRLLVLISLANRFQVQTAITKKS
jgi:hypothetical protein